MSETRIERDSLGEVAVPAGAYWGAQTQRALENFDVSGQRVPEAVISALGRIKKHAALVNVELGQLPRELSDAIARAAQEVAQGQWNEQFPLDVFQTGSGTSTHMNANEVIANRANELLGAPLGRKSPVHPNDHVNLGQSSNDVIPTAIHLAVRASLGGLDRALEELEQALECQSAAFAEIIKLGRTHLQDAVPMTLGQEFSGYASQITHGRARIAATYADLEELALGGTAVGTGLGAHPEFAVRVIGRLAGETGIPFRPATNRFEAQAARDATVAASGALNGLAVSLMKIANDLRLLSSGPRGGLAEITLPVLQPGSSIMPGKVNPVVLEVVIQVAAQVMGNHVAITVAGQHGPLELNVMLPTIANCGLGSIGLLTRAAQILATKCIVGITADAEKCGGQVQWSLAMATPLARRIGYDRAAEVAQQALQEGKMVRDVAVERGLITAQEADELFDPRHLLGPDG